jgi:hypothetical protein
MALTTTTGDCFNRLLTIVATRSIASALSTEVPPNFITIIPAPPGVFRHSFFVPLSCLAQNT